VIRRGSGLAGLDARRRDVRPSPELPDRALPDRCSGRRRKARSWCPTSSSP